MRTRNPSAGPGVPFGPFEGDSQRRGPPFGGADWRTRSLWLLFGLAMAGCGVRPAALNHTANYIFESKQKPAAESDREPQAEQPPAPKPKASPATGEVRLALTDAICRAMEGNHDIQIAGYEPRLREEDVVREEALFDPLVFLSNTFARDDRPIQSTLDTGQVADAALIEDTWTMQGGIRQRVPSGGTFSLYQETNYLDSNSAYVVPNPQYRSGLTAELKQPLLKGFGEEVNRAAIKVASLNSEASFRGFRWEVMDVVARVAGTYWRLVFDRRAIEVSRETVDLAREVLRREQVRLKQGISTELDVTRAQSALASREAELVRARVRMRDTMDRLKLLLNDPDLPLDAEVRILPTDPLIFRPVPVDRAEAVAKALARRPDLENARTAVAINQIRLDVADHERLPKLDAVLRYTLNGLGGDAGDAADVQYGDDYFGWAAGFEFEIPLGNREARSDHRKRLFEYERSLLEADRLAAQAIQEVNVAVRAVLSAREEVEATRQAKTAADQTVRGEHVRFELGRTTNEDLLRAQDILAAAERQHLRALLNFNVALINLGFAQGTLLDDLGIEVVGPEEDQARRLEPLRVRLQESGEEASP